MKTILVDAINALILKDKGIFAEMRELLDSYPYRKIILTGADDEQMKRFGFDRMPYEVFTLKHDPEKTDPRYYTTMLRHFGLGPKDVIYFEHNEEAVESARKAGINTFHYDKEKKDIQGLKRFIDANL